MAMWRRWPPGLAHAVSCSVGHGVGVGLAAAPRQDVAHVIGRMMKDFGVKGAVCALYSMRVSNKNRFSRFASAGFAAAPQVCQRGPCVRFNTVVRAARGYG